MKRVIDIAIGIAFTALFLAVVFLGLSLRETRHETELYRQAMDEVGLHCVRLDHGAAEMVCATTHGDGFAVGFDQPVRSEGDEQ